MLLGIRGFWSVLHRLQLRKNIVKPTPQVDSCCKKNKKSELFLHGSLFFIEKYTRPLVRIFD